LSRNENTSQTLLREKRGLEEKSKDLFTKVRRLECDLVAEETHREQAKTHLSDLVRRLCLCLGIDVCETSHLTPETILGKAGEVVSELQRLRTKLAATCESLAACEAELMNVRSSSAADRMRLQSQTDSLQSLSQGLETRARQAEKELAMASDRLAESELNCGKLREELRGLENRSARLQNNTERLHADRLQFLRHIGNIVGVAEPCETLIKDKIRELTTENQTLHSVRKKKCNLNVFFTNFHIFLAST
jgi:chromosome segregation ATPase